MPSFLIQIFLIVLRINFVQHRLEETAAAVGVAAAFDWQFWKLIFGISAFVSLACRAGVICHDQPQVFHALVIPHFLGCNGNYRILLQVGTALGANRRRIRCLGVT